MSRTHVIAVAVTVTVLVAGCSSSGGKKGSSTSSSAPPAAGVSKAAFVSQLNALCSSTDKQVKAIPVPSGPTDYATIEHWVTTTLALYSTFRASASGLINKSADKVELTRNYLDADAADFAAAAPLMNQLVAAAKAKNTARTTVLFDQLSKTADHSTEIAAYLKNYGLTDCATLESS